MPLFNRETKCYNLNTNKNEFVSAVKTSFIKQSEASEGEDGAKVLVQNKGINSSHERIKQTKSYDSRGFMVALPSSEKNGYTPGNFDKDYGHLDILEHGRQRFVSNDSGHGKSEYSCMGANSRDIINGLDETDDTHEPQECQCLLPSKELARHSESQPIRKPFPSDDISFIPPDPSVNSETDIDIENKGQTDDTDHMCKGINYDHQKCTPVQTMHMCVWNKQIESKSMDSLMDQLAEINERSEFIMQNANPGEVFSVFDGSF